MARRALDGSFTAFYWGQEYGGSQEALLVAALLAVRVPARWAMELVPVGLHLAAAALVWAVARQLGSSTARSRADAAQSWWPVLAAGVCWAGSPALLWWSTKERGFYGFTLVCGLVVLLLVLRSCCPSGDHKGDESGGRTTGRATSTAFGLGLAAGMGWWSSPQILHFVVPAGTWLVWSRRRSLGSLARTLAIALPAAVLGALPWIWANVHTGLASLEAAGDRRLFGNPFDVFFRYGVPMVLGLKAPITLGWEFAGATVLYVAVLVGLVALLVARPRPLRLVLLAIAAYPLVFAVLPTTYYYGEPRYLDFLWPLLALVAGWALTRLHVVGQVVLVVGLLAVTANGVAGMVELHGPPGEPFEDLAPEPVGELVDALDSIGAERVFADYWVAYRLTWETHEHIVATPLQLVRDERIDAEVRAAATGRPVYVEARRCEGLVQQALRARGIGFEVTPVAGTWDVVAPEERVLPEDLDGALGC